jgi:hypothetical protein
MTTLEIIVVSAILVGACIVWIITLRITLGDWRRR